MGMKTPLDNEPPVAYGEGWPIDAVMSALMGFFAAHPQGYLLILGGVDNRQILTIATATDGQQMTAAGQAAEYLYKTIGDSLIPQPGQARH